MFHARGCFRAADGHDRPRMAARARIFALPCASPRKTGRFPPGPEPTGNAARAGRPAAAGGPLDPLGPIRSLGCASAGQFQTISTPAHVTVQCTGPTRHFFGVAATPGRRRAQAGAVTVPKDLAMLLRSRRWPRSATHGGGRAHIHAPSCPAQENRAVTDLI